MKHTLIIIGFVGNRRAYLDLPREEAVRRFREECGGIPESSIGDEFSFEFTDEFGVYDAWSLT